MTYLTQLTVTSSYVGGVLPALLILGLGFGMIFAPAINTATAGVPRQDSGVASALVNTMQQVGGGTTHDCRSPVPGRGTSSQRSPQPSAPVHSQAAAANQAFPCGLPGAAPVHASAPAGWTPSALRTHCTNCPNARRPCQPIQRSASQQAALANPRLRCAV